MMIPLQTTGIGCLPNNGGWQCFVESTLGTLGGQAMAAFIIGGILMLSIYMASGYHPAPPAILAFVLGGILIPALPGQYQAVGTTIMLMGLVVGVWAILKNYTLEVGR